MKNKILLFITLFISCNLKSQILDLFYKIASEKDSSANIDIKFLLDAELEIKKALDSFINYTNGSVLKDSGYISCHLGYRKDSSLSVFISHSVRYADYVFDTSSTPPIKFAFMFYKKKLILFGLNTKLKIKLGSCQTAFLKGLLLPYIKGSEKELVFKKATDYVITNTGFKKSYIIRKEKLPKKK